MPQCIGINGLAGPWFGNVWVNPPFDAIQAWVQRAWGEAQTRQETEVLDGSKRWIESVSLICPTKTEQPWWHRLVEPFRDRSFRPSPFDLHHGVRVVRSRTLHFSTHFLPKRQGFIAPGGRKLGSPRWNLVLLHWRVTYIGEPT